YPGPKPINGVYEGDYDAMLAARPTYVVFNGRADLFKDSPLVARPNELIRTGIRRTCCTASRPTTSRRAARRCSSYGSPTPGCTRSSRTRSHTPALVP